MKRKYFRLHQKMRKMNSGDKCYKSILIRFPQLGKFTFHETKSFQFHPSHHRTEAYVGVTNVLGP